MKDLLNTNSIKNNVIIYGAGKIGRRLSETLSNSGIKVIEFWDKDADIIDNLTDIPIVKPNLDFKDKNIIIIIAVFSDSIVNEIKNNLLKKEFKKIISNRDEINNLLYNSCKNLDHNELFKLNISKCIICPVISDTRSFCNIFEKNIQKLNYNKEISEKKKPLIIKSIGILATSKCPLTCVGCNHLRDIYKPKDNTHGNRNEILSDLKKFLSSIDFLNKVTLVGGEAMQHPEFDEILEDIINLPKIGIVHIITNAVIMPSEKAIKLMRNKRVYIEISGYGNNIPLKFQNRLKEFIKILKTYQISYIFIKNLEWFDFGNFVHRNDTLEVLKKKYYECCFIAHDLLDGKLFKCSRSAYGTKIGSIKDYPEDYVDIRNTNKNELRLKLDRFINEKTFVEACQHCNGATELRMPAGVQLKQIDEKKRIQPNLKTK